MCAVRESRLPLDGYGPGLQSARDQPTIRFPRRVRPGEWLVQPSLPELPRTLEEIEVVRPVVKRWKSETPVRHLWPRLSEQHRGRDRVTDDDGEGDDCSRASV